MRQPSYHLRPNKAADRLAFLEALKRLETFSAEGLGAYTYYGLGGPYLEEFRLLYEAFPDIGMVSIENDPETARRQRFHLPCSTMRIATGDVFDYIGSYDPRDAKSVFWLDYTRLAYRNFESFKTLLARVAEDSMIKITLRCDVRDFGVGFDAREADGKS